MRSIRASLLATMMLLLAACGGEPPPAAPEPEPQAPAGKPLSAENIGALAKAFGDNPLTGGQTAPRLYRWVNPKVALFLQFDDPDPAKATALRYIGVSVKGVFCAEDQPGGTNGGFVHFHALKGKEYKTSHGGPPGNPGYWLSFVAVDEFTQKDGRTVQQGVDYEMSPTPPPKCGKKTPKADFTAPSAKTLSKDGIAELAALFPDKLLTGGQTAPRLYRWVNENVAIFAQFDDKDPAKATALPYIGISKRGEFCAADQPKDFPHFHRVEAADYKQGHGGEPHAKGHWLLWLATADLEQKDGRKVHPGVDRAFSPTPPPDC